MQTFSISAPTLTEEEQKRERDALTDAERLEIRQDVDGTACFVETDEMVAEGLEQFQQELLQIPIEQKEAYVEAMQACPDLVQTETNPIKFLRCEHFHAKNAARRMVRNWEMRRSAFGEKRAFQSMTLDGALSDDMQTLHTGFFTCLRNGTVDKRAMILFDRPKLSHSIYDRDSAHRVMWYMFHVASEDSFSQRNGAIVLVDAQHYQMEHFDRKLSRRMWQLLDECTPIRLSAVHFCTAMSRSTYSIIMPSVLQLMGRRNRLRTVVHTGPRHMDGLLEYGLPKQCIPKALGGDMTTQQYQDWIERRREIERQK